MAGKVTFRYLLWETVEITSNKTCYSINNNVNIYRAIMTLRTNYCGQQYRMIERCAVMQIVGFSVLCFTSDIRCCRKGSCRVSCRRVSASGPLRTRCGRAGPASATARCRRCVRHPYHTDSLTVTPPARDNQIYTYYR